MNLVQINENINRLLANIWAILGFFKEYLVDPANDVSMTFINADGTETTRTFPNIAKQIVLFGEMAIVVDWEVGVTSICIGTNGLFYYPNDSGDPANNNPVNKADDTDWYGGFDTLGDAIKARDDMMLTSGRGFKNLWINGNFQVWSHGDSGDISNIRYETDRTLIRALDVDGVGTLGTATWEKVSYNDRNSLKITHTNASAFGYIATRLTKDMLTLLKGKTVTLSFEYKFSNSMNGDIGFRVDYDQDEILESVVGGDTNVIYIGDNTWRKQEITVTLENDIHISNDSDYLQIMMKYQDAGGSIPDGTYEFSRIQLELGDVATDLEVLDNSVEEMRCSYFYKEIRYIRTSPYSVRYHIRYDFGTPMRVTPILTYNALGDGTLVSDDTSNQFLSLLFDATDPFIITSVICDAEIY